MLSCEFAFKLCTIQLWNTGFVTLVGDYIPSKEKKTFNSSICLHTSCLTFTPHWLIERLFVIISRGSCWLSGIPGLPRVQKLQATDINNLFKSDDSSVTCWYDPLYRSLKNGYKLTCCSNYCMQLLQRASKFNGTHLQTWTGQNHRD